MAWSDFRGGIEHEASFCLRRRRWPYWRPGRRRPSRRPVKIGFISTFSGPTAVIGNDMRNSFELALDHLGRKMGGLPVEVIYEDDQQKPDVGKQKTEKLIESDKVDFIVGYIWSNVLLASLKPVVDSQTFLISANAGPSQIAGELCSPYVFSTSVAERPDAAGDGPLHEPEGREDRLPDRPELRRRQGHARRRRLDLQGPGDRRGTHQVAGPARLLRRAVEGARRQARRDLRVLSGRAGVQFLTQYAQAGLKGQIPLYTAFTIDSLSLPLQKDLALGVPGRAGMGQRSAQRRQQEIRRRLPRQVQNLSVVLRRAGL